MKNQLRFFFLIILFFLVKCIIAQEEYSKINVYFFPGQGSDKRIFSKIELPAKYEAEFISYPVPAKNQTLEEYAMIFVPLIDTTAPFVLIGHSLGGMICTELTNTLAPLKTIIISSAKSSHEIPFRYRFQKVLPVYKLIPKKLIKTGAIVLQPIVETDRNKYKETFKAMLKTKDPLYLKRTIHMIINWKRKTHLSGIVHIHGDNDHTLPIRNINYDYRVNNGSHMMILTRSKEINRILCEILLKFE